MESNRTPPRRSEKEKSDKSDRKLTPNANNSLWYVLALISLLVVGISVWQNNREVTMRYSDFVQLLEKTNPASNEADRSIDVEDGTGSSQRIVRFSKPNNIVIAPYKISGKVTREELVSPGVPKVETITDSGKDKDSAETASKPVPPKPEEVEFTVDRDPEEKRVADTLASYPSDEQLRWSYTSGPSAWRNYIPVLFVTALCLFLFFFMMRRLGGAGSPMAFGRSRGKLYVQEDIEINFDDVAGIDEAVEEVREIVEFLRTPEKYQALGGRIPKGVLLVGPPGTGKTLLGKAIAGEAGVPFFSLSGSDFVEMFVGVGAARVRDLFQQAEAKSPCIVFIDELDALGKTRGSGAVGGHDEREQTLNALLVEMDGFDSNTGIIILGATNRPETLDPALLRPGRFDRHVLVDRPDVAGREQILKVHLRNVKVSESVNPRTIASITSGFVGADLANLVNEAALLAARKGKAAVGMQEFNEAVERSTAGLEKKQRIMQPDEKQRVAYHEAGHALVAYSLPNTDPVHKVSIIPRGLAALGYTLQRPEEDRYLMTRGELESRVQVLLGGTLAEEMIFEDVSTGAQNDLERASEIARSMVMDFGMSRLGRVTYRDSGRSPFLAGSGEARLHSHSEQTAREIDEEVKRIVDEGITRVRHLLDNRRAALIAVSERLLVQEVIDADELSKIVDANTDGPRIVPGTGAVQKRGTPITISPVAPKAANEQASGGES